LRLSFSLQSEPVIRDGIQRLARAIASFGLMSQEPGVGRMSETA
jgi:hypothetical protein